jgi:hypothetical protein
VVLIYSHIKFAITRLLKLEPIYLTAPIKVFNKVPKLRISEAKLDINEHTKTFAPDINKLLAHFLLSTK